MKIRFQVNGGERTGTYDREHPALPRRGDIVHLAKDGEHAFCVVSMRHVVSSDVAIHVVLRTATTNDLRDAGCA